MKILFTVAPQFDRHGREHPSPVWPEGWPVPRVDDEVRLADGTSTRVHVVEWCPDGDDGSPEPFVYLVLRA